MCDQQQVERICEELQTQQGIDYKIGSNISMKNVGQFMIKFGHLFQGIVLQLSSFLICSIGRKYLQ